jgi:VWFA-related protein
VRDVPEDVSTNDLAERGRLVVILMDRSIPFGLPAVSARRMAKAAIEQLTPGDLAAVVYTGSGTPQDFTSDRARLLAAIGERPDGGLSRNASEQWATQQDRLEADTWTIDDALRGVSRILPSDNNGECYCGLCVLASITAIADALRDTRDRQKSMLFIGADISTDNTADPRCQSAVIDARRTMLKSLDLANLTVHALDANGLESNVVAANSQGASVTGPISSRPGLDNARNGVDVAANPSLMPAASKSQQIIARQGRLAILPDHTGGRMVLNNNNPEDRVPDLFRESASYYLLGFDRGTADGREHTIQVQVNRRDVRVRARRGYVAPSPATASGASVDRVHATIEHVIPERHGLTLTANPLVFATPTTHDPVVILALHAQHEGSQERPTANPGPSIDIATTVFTTDGRPVGMFHQTLDVQPASSPAAPLGYDVLQRLPAKPGRYELRTAVTDTARGQSGSVYAFVDIPASSKVPFSWSDVGLSALTAKPATKDSVTDVVPALPLARRTFDRQEQVTAFIRGYRGSGVLPTPIELVSRIVDERDRNRLEQKAAFSQANFDASQQMTYAIDLPLKTLEPGSYLLTMEAKAGKVRTTRNVRFTVRLMPFGNSRR